MMVSIGMNMLPLTRETPHDSLLDFYIIIEVEHGTLILVTFQIQPFSPSMIMAERVEVRSRQLMRVQHLIFTGVLELISNSADLFLHFGTARCFADHDVAGAWWAADDSRLPTTYHTVVWTWLRTTGCQRGFSTSNGALVASNGRIDSKCYEVTFWAFWMLFQYVLIRTLAWFAIGGFERWRDGGEKHGKNSVRVGGRVFMHAKWTHRLFILIPESLQAAYSTICGARIRFPLSLLGMHARWTIDLW